MSTPAARAAIKKTKKLKKAVAQREQGGPIGGTSGVQYNPTTHMEMYNADRSMLLIVPIADIISLPEAWRPEHWPACIALRHLQLCPKYDACHNSKVTHLTKENAEKNTGKFVTSQNNVVTPHGSQGQVPVVYGESDDDDDSDDSDDDDDAPMLDEDVLDQVGGEVNSNSKKTSKNYSGTTKNNSIEDGDDDGDDITSGMIEDNNTNTRAAPVKGGVGLDALTQQERDNLPAPKLDPNDCPFTGSHGCARCRYVHARTENATAKLEVHVNKAYDTLKEAQSHYECFPAGHNFAVAPPNSAIVTDEIPSYLVIKTRCMQSSRKVLSHCAHYFFNGCCNRGNACFFIHAISLNPLTNSGGNNDDTVKDKEHRRIWGRTLKQSLEGSALSSEARSMFQLQHQHDMQIAAEKQQAALRKSGGAGGSGSHNNSRGNNNNNNLHSLSSGGSNRGSGGIFGGSGVLPHSMHQQQQHQLLQQTIPMILNPNAHANLPSSGSNNNLSGGGSRHSSHNNSGAGINNNNNNYQPNQFIQQHPPGGMMLPQHQPHQNQHQYIMMNPPTQTQNQNQQQQQQFVINPATGQRIPVLSGSPPPQMQYQHQHSSPVSNQGSQQSTPNSSAAHQYLAYPPQVPQNISPNGSGGAINVSNNNNNNNNSQMMSSSSMSSSQFSGINTPSGAASNSTNRSLMMSSGGKLGVAGGSGNANNIINQQQLPQFNNNNNNNPQQVPAGYQIVMTNTGPILVQQQQSHQMNNTNNNNNIIMPINNNNNSNGQQHQQQAAPPQMVQLPNGQIVSIQQLMQQQTRQ